jgi:hypothetical protein
MGTVFPKLFLREHFSSQPEQKKKDLTSTVYWLSSASKAAPFFAVGMTIDSMLRILFY